MTAQPRFTQREIARALRAAFLRFSSQLNVKPARNKSRAWGEGFKPIRRVTLAHVHLGDDLTTLGANQ